MLCTSGARSRTAFSDSHTPALSSTASSSSSVPLRASTSTCVRPSSFARTPSARQASIAAPNHYELHRSSLVLQLGFPRGQRSDLHLCLPPPPSFLRPPASGLREPIARPSPLR